MKYRFTLEPYTGKASRHMCPDCLKKFCFSRYIDIITGNPIHEDVGRCNREVECGYHYKPKDFFLHNNIMVNPIIYDQYEHVNRPQTRPISFIPDKLLHESLKAYEQNNFVVFLADRFGVEIIKALIKKYFIGTSKLWPGATVFWQIDVCGKIRTGKIIPYNKDSGKRIKSSLTKVNWAHKALKLVDFNLQQCFFGEHLLKENLNKPVAIVESEKTAILASIYIPQFIWLATGGLNGCKWIDGNVNTVLRNRRIVLFPDLSKPESKINCFDVWGQKAKQLADQLPDSIIIVSDLLEKKATITERHEGLDMGDFLLRFDHRKFYY